MNTLAKGISTAKGIEVGTNLVVLKEILQFLMIIKQEMVVS